MRGAHDHARTRRRKRWRTRRPGTVAAWVSPDTGMAGGRTERMPTTRSIAWLQHRPGDNMTSGPRQRHVVRSGSTPSRCHCRNPTAVAIASAVQTSADDRISRTVYDAANRVAFRSMRRGDLTKTEYTPRQHQEAALCQGFTTQLDADCRWQPSVTWPER